MFFLGSMIFLVFCVLVLVLLLLSLSGWIFVLNYPCSIFNLFILMGCNGLNI